MAGIFIVRSLNHQHLLQQNTVLETTVMLVESNLSSLFASADHLPSPSRLHTIARELGARAAARVTFIASDGTVIADSAIQGDATTFHENQANKPEVRQALSSGQGQDIRIDETTGERTFYRAVTTAPAPPRGPIVVRVGLAATRMDRDIEQAKHTIIITLGLVFLAVSAFTVWLVHGLTQPLSAVMRAARRLTSENLAGFAKHAEQDDVGTLADTLDQIADRMQAKFAELSEDRAQLLAVLTSMIEGVMVLDRRGYVLQMNPALERIFGISRAEARGRPFTELFRNRQLSELVEETLQSRSHREAELILPLTGRCLQIEASFAGGERDNEACVVLVCHDITELRRLETIRKDFVANVSHELRTPLTSIKGYVEALLDGAKDDPEMAANFLDIILKQSDRLNLLIGDLLELSHIESGRVSFRQDPIDLRAVIDRAISTIKPLAEKKGHRLATFLEDTVPSIAGDEDRLVQVMTNLLDNAVKYTPPGGAIIVAVKRASRSRTGDHPAGAIDSAGAIELSVSDTGIGIPEADRPRVFERFYRVDKARSRELGGTGLGLAIVKHIVEGHGGEVWVEANEPKGSRFMVRLPIHSGHHSPAR
ncbi:MAG: cell wall metabolism sensor histidine kinase WalK [Nitrospira sp.]|nr:cell wall metabolism sensor histidine kinase WalK [Nitrospira sp.]MCP9461788.1 cell wall metabolism sensor histidine kinase WalK [Nitrospira sp.]MCP9473745.1 cell wall metabolism sensor histidine kinase WalK [Nitrospira sp.]